MTTVPTAGDEERLVERLRDAVASIRNDGTPSQVGLTAEECEEAAATITRLVEERDEARSGVDAFADICDELGCERDNEAGLMAAASLKAKVAELTEALRPFIPDTGEAEEALSDDEIGSVNVTLGVVRRARRVLSKGVKPEASA